MPLAPSFLALLLRALLLFGASVSAGDIVFCEEFIGVDVVSGKYTS